MLSHFILGGLDYTNIKWINILHRLWSYNAASCDFGKFPHLLLMSLRYTYVSD